MSLVVQVESGFQLEMYSVRAQTLHRNSTFSPAGIGRKSRLKSEMYSINARNVAYVSTGNRDTGVQVPETPGLDHHPQIGRVVRRSNEGASPFMNFVACPARGVTKRDYRPGAALKGAA